MGKPDGSIQNGQKMGKFNLPIKSLEKSYTFTKKGI